MFIEIKNTTENFAQCKKFSFFANIKEQRMRKLASLINFILDII